MKRSENQAARKAVGEKNLFRNIVFVICEAFAIFSFFSFLPSASVESILLAAVTALIVGFIFSFEKLFHYRINTVFYVCAMLYAMGPLLGDGYKLYYLVSGYDKLLHTTGGVVFAIIGSYIPVMLNSSYRNDYRLRAVVAICFSMAVSVAWEFCEFGADMLLGYDTQNDTIIHSINSYLLGATPGETGSTGAIESIVVNGVPMEGYIDIGLIDTMMDMLVETLGAIVYAVAFLIDKDRHPLFLSVGHGQRKAAKGNALLPGEGALPALPSPERLAAASATCYNGSEGR